VGKRLISGQANQTFRSRPYKPAPVDSGTEQDAASDRLRQVRQDNGRVTVIYLDDPLTSQYHFLQLILADLRQCVADEGLPLIG
jgi:hypothetical protein